MVALCIVQSWRDAGRHAHENAHPWEQNLLLQIIKSLVHDRGRESIFVLSDAQHGARYMSFGSFHKIDSSWKPKVQGRVSRKCHLMRRIMHTSTRISMPLIETNLFLEDKEKSHCCEANTLSLSVLLDEQVNRAFRVEEMRSLVNNNFGSWVRNTLDQNICEWLPQYEYIRSC